jgi:hypothetical protein
VTEKIANEGIYFLQGSKANLIASVNYYKLTVSCACWHSYVVMSVSMYNMYVFTKKTVLALGLDGLCNIV